MYTERKVSARAAVSVITRPRTCANVRDFYNNGSAMSARKHDIYYRIRIVQIRPNGADASSVHRPTGMYIIISRKLNCADDMFE